ncbi:hypothetical protein [Vibrio sp. F74]|uniref:hypothetical protein n=1 Tax=Vibrio sp. F74 TaxID=700020 RepID=UPI0035F58225
MFVVIMWLVFAVLVGVYASNKGRSGVGLFFVSLILSPIIGLIIALIMSPNQDKVEQSSIASGDMKKCPLCAELVRSEASVCKHCSAELT